MSNRSGLKLLSLLTVIASTAFLAAGPVAAEEGAVSVTIEAGLYEIQRTADGHEVFMEGFGQLLVPGTPSLPGKVFAVAVPPGATVTAVTFDGGDAVVLPGTYQVKPAALPRVVGQERPELYARDLERYQANHDEVYDGDGIYPADVGELVRTAGYRKYNLVDVRVTPFQYHPGTGKLAYHPAVTVNVRYTLPEKYAAGALDYESLPRCEQTAREIICNYEQAQAWYPKSATLGGRGLHDYVIITLSSLISAVQPLVTWETAKGRTVEVVTTDYINANSSGYDLAEKMRNFLRDKLGAWGIEDVCLIGHYDNVPMRRTAQDLGYGQPETDFYFAELSKPDNTSWDANVNHQWGENSDPIDFYNEVNVGRIPWSDYATVEHICNKSAAYENNGDMGFKKNMLLLGAFFWPNTDNAVLMEYKTNPALHPWMSEFTLTRMYEQGSSSYPMNYDLKWNNVRNVWSAGKYAFVNWAGHGSPTGCYIYYSTGESFSNTSTCDYLNDDYPSIIFADACSNSDTDHLNLGQAMLKQGGVGFVGSTKVAYGSSGWSNPNHGSSQSMDYYFTTSVTSGDYTQGAGHQRALRTMYQNGLWYSNKYETFEWGALWGNPDLSMGTLPPLKLKPLAGMPEGTQPPGLANTCQVEVLNGTESYVPGSGLMHYRFDPDDPYTPVSMDDLANHVCEGTLPGTRPGDAPEFYFSFQGDGGSTVTLPPAAPSTVFSFDVAFAIEVWGDDFETNKLWVVGNTNIQTGAWERADPIGTEAQPGDDHSPDGTKCFVTGRLGGGIGDDDVDGGPTRLKSPPVDLSSGSSLGDAYVSFYLWFYHSTNGTFQPLEIQITGTGGAPWTTVENLSHAPAWNHYEYRVADYLTVMDQVQVRFNVCDDPNDSVVEAALDDFVIIRKLDDPTLWANDYDISAATGAVIDFTLAPGPAHAGRPYLLLGSATGMDPGLPLPGGAVLPIKWDVVTGIIMGALGSPVFANFTGTIDGAGEAVATLNTYGALDPATTGVKLYFAYLLSVAPFYASTPIVVEIDP